MLYSLFVKNSCGKTYPHTKIHDLILSDDIVTPTTEVSKTIMFIFYH